MFGLPAQAWVPRGAREKPEVGTVGDGVIEKTMPYLSAMAADMVRIGRLIGCKPGELLSMTAHQIDLTDPELWGYRPSRTKSQRLGKDRVISLGPEAVALLRLYLITAGEHRLFQLRQHGLSQANLKADRDARREVIQAGLCRRRDRGMGAESLETFGLQ
jgi:integrase